MQLCPKIDIFRPTGRRASQLPTDYQLLPPGGFKGGRRVSTGMLEGAKHQLFFRRRHLASTAENVAEEEESEGEFVYLDNLKVTV